MKRPLSLFFICLFFLLSTIFLLRYSVIRQAVYGDGIYYWAYTRSLVVDNNLNFQNEGAHQYGPDTNNKNTQEKGSERTDLARNKYYPLGPSLAWLFPFSLIHIVLTVFHLFSANIVFNGYSDLYQIVLGIFDILLVIAGINFIYMILKKYFSEPIAIGSTLILLFATNLLYYASFDVLNSHPISFLLSSFFLYIFLAKKRSMRLPQWFMYGILLGLMATVRPQDGLLGILPATFLLKHIAKKRNSESSLAVISYILGSFIGFSPQLIVSKIIYGTFFLLPYGLGNQHLNLFDNKIVEIFFNPQKGLLLTMPLFIIGIVGIFLFQKKLKDEKTPFLLVIFAEVLLVGGWSGWSQGEAYGMRMFISILPFIALGIGCVVEIIKKRLSKESLIIIGALFVLQNLILIGAFHLFFHNPTYIGNQISQSGKLKMQLLLYLSGEKN